MYISIYIYIYARASYKYNKWPQEGIQLAHYCKDDNSSCALYHLVMWDD